MIKNVKDIAKLYKQHVIAKSYQQHVIAKMEAPCGGVLWKATCLKI